MQAIGIPLGRLKVEGDDMIAAITPTIRDKLDMSLITEAGLQPEYKVLPMDEAEFCSRRIIDVDGTPKLCRDPRREIRRTGFSIHNETQREKLLRGIHEWEGLPMFGPLYQSAANESVTPISSATRASFALAWGISQDEQRKFEEDHDFRAEFAQEIASPGATPTGDRYRAIQGTARPSSKRNHTVSVHPRVERITTPRRTGQDVRDVPSAGSCESAVSSGSRDNNERGGTDRRRLRRKGRSTKLPGDSCIVPKEHDPRVEGLSSGSSTQQSNEAEVACDRH